MLDRKVKTGKQTARRGDRSIEMTWLRRCGTGARSILENRLGVSPISDFKFCPAAALVECERSVDGFTQELSDGAGCEVAPFDADAVSVFARHVGFDRRSFMPRVRRQKEGDLNPGQHPRIELGLDERTADAQVDQPPVPHDKPMGRYPH